MLPMHVFRLLRPHPRPIRGIQRGSHFSTCSGLHASFAYLGLAAILFAAIAILGNPSGARAATQMAFDIVINGGTFSAPAAAFQAARMNPDAQILLVEPMLWLGGQATSQGVAAIDNPYHSPGGALMRNNPELYYAADYRDFLARIKAAPSEAPGDGYAGDAACWVSRDAFDPRTAAWVLDQMAGEFSNLTVMYLTVVKDVSTAAVEDDHGSGVVITGLTLIRRTPIAPYKPFDKYLSQELPDWYDPQDSADYAKEVIQVAAREAGRGLVVVEASELADAVVLSGATYTVGREKTTEKIADNGTLPEMNELGDQAFVFPFCMTGGTELGAENELTAAFPDFQAYYDEQVSSYFSMGSYSWARIWTYRRIKNTAASGAYDTALAGDVSMQNWYPGNDYPYGTLYKTRADTAAEAAAGWQGGIRLSELARAEKHAIAWYFFMKANRSVAWDTRMPHGDHPLNMMGTGTGLSMFPYIRSTRRTVGLDNFRITQRYFVDTKAADYVSGSSFRYYDSVGIGNYTVDVHPTYLSTGMAISVHYPAPFYVPYRALGSVNVRNLLAAGKTLAVTFITNAGYRLHPIEWAIGSGAGGAAGLMSKNGWTNYDLLVPERLRALQSGVNANSPISWAAFDANPIPSQNGEIVANDLKAVESTDFPFDVEIYHYKAVQAQVYLNGRLLGTTTQRANGRLLYSIASAAPGTATITANCLDADGNLLDILTGTVVIKGTTIKDLTIIDNDDPEFSVVGTWTRATAQGDKYGASYHYASGGSGEKTATWKLYTPAAGMYEVFTWYPEAYNRATDSPFTIFHADGQTTVRINQQTNGGRWVPLGAYRFTGPNTGRVVLSNNVSNATLLVLADAIRVVPVIPGTSWHLY